MKPLTCQTDTRREAVRANEGWNGLDFVEVDSAQTTLTVFFLGKAPRGIAKENLTLEGGRSEKDRVQIEAIDVRREESGYFDDYMLVEVDKPGDYSTYTLTLTRLEKIDPRYASVEFSFKANCPTDLDCAPSCGCEPETFDKPAIDYLAKDYAGFRRLILDRLSLICPDWRERHVPDLGIAIVEILAYTGDYLSYYQDAVATEAYLETARRRPSVRRHARLVDYRLSEGSNARAFVAMETGSNVSFKSADVRFITGVKTLIPIGDRAALQARELDPLPAVSYEVFEPLGSGADIHVWRANNVLRFYTWGGRECCIRKGATAATLRGELEQGSPQPNDPDSDGKPDPYAKPDDYNKQDAPPATDGEAPAKVHLQAGDVLIFEELMGPVTGQPGDADPRHRQAVRLTAVTASRDELAGESIIEIEWGEEDALRFDLCLSAVGAAPECKYLDDISVARGNVILVDHGRPVGPEDLGEVPTRGATQCCECEGQPSDAGKVAGRYRPQLKLAPLTFAAPMTTPSGSAADLLRPNALEALPSIALSSNGGDWTPRYDLLACAGDDRHFVVEMEENGVANIRFGDGELGAGPTPGASFAAHYRIGNGRAGNVGADAISLLVHRDSDLSNDIQRVWNPLPAQGGTAAEPMAEAKLNAPYAFRFGLLALARAITPYDYARIAERHLKIQRAAARLAWIGSWFEAEVGIDVKAAYAAHSTGIAAEIEAYLEDFRRIGHDLDVRIAEYAPIDLALKVCIAPEYLRGHVKASLLDAFSSRKLVGGASGFFHADRLTFGDDIRLSALVAAAHSVPGVVSVQVKRLQRQFESSNHEIENGLLPLGPFEIARLENDPNYPDRGRLEIAVAGGR